MRVKVAYLLTKLAKTYWVLDFAPPFWGHCKLPFWYRYAHSLFCHYALAGFEVFYKEVPKLQGSNLVLHWPRWGVFLEFEGQYHVRPSPDIFSTCVACLMDFMGRFGPLKLLCQLLAF